VNFTLLFTEYEAEGPQCHSANVQCTQYVTVSAYSTAEFRNVCQAVSDLIKW